MSQTAYDVAAAVFLLAGSLLSLAAGVGLVRFPDTLSRMHAATKPQIFGLILILAAIALEEHTLGVVASLLVVLVFQMLTAPISAHMIGRAGYRNGDVDRDLLVVDEFEEAVDRAGAELDRVPDDDIDEQRLAVGSPESVVVERRADDEARHEDGPDDVDREPEVPAGP